MTIRGRLVFLALGILGAVVAMGGLAYVNSRAIVTQQLEETGSFAAEAAAANVELYLQKRANLLEDVATAVEQMAASGASQQQILDVLTQWTKKTENLREPLQNPFLGPLLRATGEMHPHVGPAGVCLSPWGAFPRDQGPLLPLRPIRRPASPGR